MVPDNQLAQMKIKQGCKIHLGALIPTGELPNSMLSLPDVITSQLLEPYSNAAEFGEVHYFLIQHWLIGQ